MEKEALMKARGYRKALAAALAVGAGCAGVLFLLKRDPARETSPQVSRQPDLAQARYLAPSAAPDSSAPGELGRSGDETAPERRDITSAKYGGKPKAIIPAPSQAAAPSGKEPIKDPLARVALAWVGADPEAEVYWVEAINDPSLPAKERQDLIEDLNEDGLSDPRHPTLDDLPLIVSRLEWIEALAPDAMDKVNADAFAEAYKDLSNMYNTLAGPR
jgi:hypothetical protein